MPRRRALRLDDRRRPAPHRSRIRHRRVPAIPFLHDRADGRSSFRSAADGQQAHECPVPGLKGATVTASSRSLLDNFVAAGLSDGRISLMQLRFSRSSPTRRSRDVSVDVVDAAPFDRSIRRDSLPVRFRYVEQDGQKFAASLVGDARDRVLVDGRRRRGASARRCAWRRASTSRTSALAATATSSPAPTRGRVYHWEAGEEPLLTDMSPVSTGRSPRSSGCSAATRTCAAPRTGGSAAGSGRRSATGERMPWSGRTTSSRRPPPSRPSRCRPASAASRPRADDGSIVLRHQTSERTLVDASAGGAVSCSSPSRRAATGCSCARGDSVEPMRFTIRIPRSAGRCSSARSGTRATSQPEYVWQSTGATDDFEAKFSLVPLIFGTIKGTFYALLFAIPLAVFGALYTSQFVHPDDPKPDQADRRNHGGAAERRHRVPRRAVPGNGRRAEPRRRLPDDGAPAAVRHRRRPRLATAAPSRWRGGSRRAPRCS